MTEDDEREFYEVIAGSLIRMADTPGAIAEANDYYVPIELFKKAVQFVARIGPGQDFVKRAWTMTVLFVGEVPDDELLPLQRTIETRMQALAGLKNEPAFKAWSIKTSPDVPASIEEVLVEVAARETLIEREGRPAFEPESFFAAVLEKGAVLGEG